jgi:hypothetical protein
VVQFLFWGFASCCAHFVKVIGRAVSRNNCSRCLVILISCRYIFRICCKRGNYQKYCIFRLKMTSKGQNMWRQNISINKHLEQLLRERVLPITVVQFIDSSIEVEICKVHYSCFLFSDLYVFLLGYNFKVFKVKLHQYYFQRTKL